MSTDDFFQDPESLFEKWISQPWSDFSCLSESIDSNNIIYVKKAFVEGYKIGFDAKKNLNWVEQNQK